MKILNTILKQTIYSIILPIFFSTAVMAKDHGLKSDQIFSMLKETKFDCEGMELWNRNRSYTTHEGVTPSSQDIALKVMQVPTHGKAKGVFFIRSSSVIRWAHVEVEPYVVNFDTIFRNGYDIESSTPQTGDEIHRLKVQFNADFSKVLSLNFYIMRAGDQFQNNVINLNPEILDTAVCNAL